MTRPLRIEFPGAFYHVMHRGNTGMDIFKGEGDRETFLEYIGKAVERYGIKVHTYCLMNTHYHLLIETPRSNLSQTIKWINVSYSIYFNRKRKRFGHLFQGRFKSVLVEADEYLKHLSRYIHLNPVRAGMVEHCKDYPWSSYRALSGYEKSPEWLETIWMLSIFGEDRDIAKKRYRDFVESVENEKVNNPSDNAVGGIVLGRTDFVEWVKSEIIKKGPKSKEISQLRRLNSWPKIDDIYQGVSNVFGCGQELILQKGKKRNVARDVAIYLSREMTGETSMELGKRFDLCGAGITIRHNRVADQLESDPELKVKVDRIRKIINS
jgi:putative transposase